MKPRDFIVVDYGPAPLVPRAKPGTPEHAEVARTHSKFRELIEDIMQRDAKFPVEDGVAAILDCLKLFGYRAYLKTDPTGFEGRPKDYYVVTDPWVASVLRGMLGLMHQVTMPALLYRILNKPDAREFLESTYRLGGDATIATIVKAEVHTPRRITLPPDPPSGVGNLDNE